MTNYKTNKEGSILANSPELINQFTKDDNFPYLVSFPRTGSHWLRMMMELYFNKPALVRIFYLKEATEFTCIHVHDKDLSLQRKNILYLYREPVNTVYSQMMYTNDDVLKEKNILYWAELYGKHLSKWLLDESFTRKKTIISYAGLQKDTEREFAKICRHFCLPLNIEKLNTSINKVTKKEVLKKTRHDPQVMNLSREYHDSRSNFIINFSDRIFQKVYEQNALLENIISIGES